MTVENKKNQIYHLLTVKTKQNESYENSSKYMPRTLKVY